MFETIFWSIIFLISVSNLIILYKRDSYVKKGINENKVKFMTKYTNISTTIGFISVIATILVTKVL